MITGIVIARNEEKNIAACLSCLGFCSKLMVIDNQSADQTAAIAKKNGASIIKTAINGDFSGLRNLALKHVTTPWALFVDADERVSPDLAAEIQSAVAAGRDISGFYLKRQDYLWGRMLQYGDTGSVYLLRLGRPDSGPWTGRVHETWRITGNISRLNLPLLHYPHADIAGFLNSLNTYSGIRAEELHSQGKSANLGAIIVYPPVKFLHLWLLKRGILDGVPGLIHALCMAFYSFLVRSKLYLLARGITDGKLH